MADREGQKVGVLQGAQTLTPDSTQLLSALFIRLVTVSRFHGNKDVVLKITDLDNDASGSSMGPERLARILVLLLTVRL